MVPIAFGSVQKEMRKFSDEEGQPLIQKLEDLNEPLDAALNSGNTKQTVEILQTSIPIVRKLVSHMDTKRHRDLFANIADELELKLVEGNIEISDFIKFGLKHIKHVSGFLGLQLPIKL